MSKIKSLFEKLTFSSVLLLAPLAYCIHHIEEKEGNFRTWRARYFLQNNPLTTEYVFIVVSFVALLLILLFSIRKSKPAANAVILFFMMSQLTNAFFHIGAGVFFTDYSPGTVTAILLYLPVNLLILYKARIENWISRKIMYLLIMLGAFAFFLFELLGGISMPILFITILTYIIIHETKLSKK
ncbi:HXXEE domain-containing protein [Aquimarina pacifica]|uniref:HXXEE domain-containing protein n=1 Tax=Aquimarina pacifica TaxID=1296415 RepID=UPI0004B932F0|nr:HXXEE domain-containing protein [Aquimarina pacifica]